MKKYVPQIFASLVLLFATATGVGAQTKTAKASAKAKSEQTQKAEPTDDLQKFRQDFIKAAEEYRASLNELSASYETSVTKAKEQQTKLEELYKDGLISRVEFEGTGKAVEEAQAKLDEVRKQIAEADVTIAAARKPVQPLVNTSEIMVAGVEPKWTTGNARIDGLIRMNAKRYGIDPYLVYCVMHQESRFGAGATSPVGAQGLMQLMPGTAARYGVTNSYDPAQNIMGGTHYLSDLLRMFGGRVDLALAGYNAGEGAVMKYGRRIPPYAETQNYVRIIGGRYTQNTGVQLTGKTSTPKASTPKEQGKGGGK
ncbi:MAG TPA: transglycosylase SLT domain-containing protein [Pyrinomonadaceae bacterium]|jgi:soluble lytic murein transglycosylase-like protein|nr:transglycosylase SLT domain-containing protein [Pyrinomonadaceae bacterium]